MQLVLINPLIGPCQVLLLQVRADLGAIKCVRCIPQSSSITGISTSDCLVSYIQDTPCGWSYPSADVQSMYSTDPADWAKADCT